MVVGLGVRPEARHDAARAVDEIGAVGLVLEEDDVASLLEHQGLEGGHEG